MLASLCVGAGLVNVKSISIAVPLAAGLALSISNSAMTNASGVQNLLKNLAAAIGTSLVATMVSRYSQAFQSHLVGFLDPNNPAYVEKLAAMTSYLCQFDVYAVAYQKAQGLLYNELLQQSTLCAYMETFRVWGIVAFLCLPLLLLYRRKKA